MSRLTEVAEAVRRAERIVFTGAGSSVLAGHCLDRMLRAALDKPAGCVPTTDLILNPALHLEPRTRGLLVSFSRSGRSPESVAAAEMVRRDFPFWSQLLITCSSDGPLISRFQRWPDCPSLVLHPSCCDQGLAMTSSFTSMVICGQMLAFDGNGPPYRRLVQDLSRTAEPVLTDSARLAAALPAASRVCLIGGQLWRGAAAEGALKILELTNGGICTLAESFLGIRHGPLSFVDSQTLIVAFLSSEKTMRRYEIDLLREIAQKKLGLGTLAVGYELEEARSWIDDGIELHTPGAALIEDRFRPPLDVLLPQVLALAFSLGAGLDPDNPSPGGVINRVVDGVRIYS